MARALATLGLLGLVVSVSPVQAEEPIRTIEILADADSRFKIPGQKKPVIEVRANETVTFRVVSRKGDEFMADGTAHSFTVREFIEDGWHVALKEGTQTFTLTVPNKPGKYYVVCIVPCGKNHHEMRMKLIVKK